MPKFPRGSEWRRWDLHVHTPSSTLNHHFGNDFDAYAKALFLAAIDNKIAVVGVTDYFVIDGYEKLRAIQRDEKKLTALVGASRAEAARSILLLPNIELRVDPVIWVNDRAAAKVNLHVIFSEDVDPADIKSNFLAQLNFTFQANPQAADETRSLTKENLVQFGEALRKQHSKFKNADPLWLGMNQVLIRHDDVSQVLSSKPSLFGGKHLIVLEPNEDLSKLDWDDAGHSSRKQLIQKADALFCSNEPTRRLFLGQTDKLSPNQVRQQVRSLKPSLTGSDAHDEKGLFHRPRQDYTWIKADPTFRGLLQILHEPHDRVFVGKTPPELERQSSDPTNIMREVNFERQSSAPNEHVWFSGTTVLNPGLVAVIGRKGSGKSALADVLALLGQTDRTGFEFLNENRFLQGEPSLGSHFTAELVWASSGRSGMKSLEEPVDPNASPSVTYLPQRYISTICDDVDGAAREKFEQELQRVIFSHVPEEDRDDASTLEEYLSKATRELRRQVVSHRGALQDLINRIVQLETRLSPDAVSRLKEEEARCRRAFDAVIADPPKPAAESVKTPPSGPGSLGSAQHQLAAANQKLGECESALQRARTEAKKANSRLEAAKRIQQVFATARAEAQSWREAIQSEAKMLGLNVETLIDLRLDDGGVRNLLEAAELQSKSHREQLDEKAKNSAAWQAVEQKAIIGRLQAELELPQRLHQEYLAKLKAWESKKAEIDGDATKPNTLKWFAAQREALKEIPAEIRKYEAKRDKVVAAIFGALGGIRDIYRKMYGPVEQATRREQSAAHLPEFRAEIVAPSFIEYFLDFIDAGATGSFQGRDQGRERLRQMLKNTRFETEQDVLAFVRGVRSAIDQDIRNPLNFQQVTIEGQLRKGKTRAKLLQYVYGLDYLEHRFALRWNGKAIEQLSPGERGTLLLLFYLTIDQDSRPLIVDQPEENLDNQTVYSELVHAIKSAKKRRQIIIVTHSPNLAVVCDAEQIIVADMDKEAGNRVRYHSGSIEDPQINEKVVNVLEGTRPAFTNREVKYRLGPPDT